MKNFRFEKWSDFFIFDRAVIAKRFQYFLAQDLTYTTGGHNTPLFYFF
jgi:hypothetical protein